MTTKVEFTKTQVKTLHAALSMILNDPAKWEFMIGGPAEFANLGKAHEKLMAAMEKDVKK